MTGSGAPAPRRVLLLKAAGFLLGSASGLAMAWAVGFLWFVATLPQSVADPATATDAVVVLTGGSERLDTGMRLVEAGLAHRLFISGVHKDVDVGDVLRLVKGRHDDLADSLVLGHAADDTVGNAIETARWMRDEKVGSIRLVTGAYHMPRALVEFRRAVPDATILPHPVFPDAVKSQEWWRWPGTAALLATEYSKYLAAVIRHWFLPRKPLP